MTTNFDCATLQIVIVTYNSNACLTACLEAIEKCRLPLQYETLVFDNGSSTPPQKAIEHTFSNTKLFINEKNIGFGRANNRAIEFSTSELILLINPDAFVQEHSIENAIRVLYSNDKFGLIGGSLFSPDGKPEPSARYCPTPWRIFENIVGVPRALRRNKLNDSSWSRQQDISCDWVPGCFYLMRRSLVNQIGLFDSRYFLYYEEVDHCKRVRDNGYQVICAADVVVSHVGGASAETVSELSDVGRQISPLLVESELLFMRKQYGLWGLLCHVGLSQVSIAVICLRGLVRKEGFHIVARRLPEAKQMLSICFATKFGRQSVH
jgi:N-acetylglucosaminyl-diphospho-decaprenol L-rhamnosyltransferase